MNRLVDHFAWKNIYVNGCIKPVVFFIFMRQVPVLVIGTKASRAKGQPRRGLHIADLCGAEQIFVDSTGDGEHNSGLAPGSSNAVKLSRFFDKVRTTLHSVFFSQ